MYQNLKISHTTLRLALAIVFLWFGIDKFLHPQYWINAWLPQSVAALAHQIRIDPEQIIYANGVFELLVSISLWANIFVEVFSFLAVLFLVAVSFFHGFNEVLVRDIGLAGGLLALTFWPSRPNY